MAELLKSIFNIKGVSVGTWERLALIILLAKNESLSLSFTNCLLEAILLSDDLQFAYFKHYVFLTAMQYKAVSKSTTQVRTLPPPSANPIHEQKKGHPLVILSFPYKVIKFFLIHKSGRLILTKISSSF